MASVKLTAPNGRTYLQPTGLFINNQWIKSSDGGKIVSINPTNEKEIISVYAATAHNIDKSEHPHSATPPIRPPYQK
ncbi:aldehyde dehydrogenase [Colletotrichum lupini]|uniref:Aldehyde dehydrogenase n=1 Tax=Colletotrichum lupini TaxID=145971 RepID=A0A9Q8SEW8_9PEZI|nr:aldehyde dehydrogenase [Colletotrichum lupini]KAK1701874.1 hypothetical protein BDP67DRAFT_625584 [Colletotrichum lupini]UQC75715.1 aldehyde dehydrogenase [Colletotrichum lupini]